jgi:two-component system sensor histidine kinase MtrB
MRLSVRITATFAAGALLVAVILAAGAYFLTSHFLIQQQERSALRQSLFSAAVVRDGLQAQAPDVPGLLDTLPSGAETNAVIEKSGRWYSSSLTVSRDALPDAVRRRVLAGEVVRAWGKSNAHPALVVGVALPAVDGAYFQLIDESALDRTLSVLRAVLLAAAVVATAAGASVGWWASRRLTAPLRTVAAAAERIAAGDLHTHLPSEIDGELAGLVTSFNAMVDALRGRIERDARFAGDVSHELRSPLTTLSTSLSVLQGRRDELSERGRGALDLLAFEVSRFQRLVEDLLEISRSDAGEATSEREPVRICELVLNLLADARYGDIKTDIDSRLLDSVVIGDKRRLEQALRNLLDNAEAHAGGATCVAVQPSPSGVALIVDDAGPGVPVEERDRIFDRFARGRTARRRGSAGGTGLGLALVREHAQAHGGEVAVCDRPGGGARFVIELPAEETR